MLRKFFLFLPFLLGAANVARADGPERIPVVVNIDPNILAAMPAEQRSAVEAAAMVLRDEMTTWATAYKPGVPSSSFPAGAELIQIKDFFKVPQASAELESIGAGRPLALAEIDQLAGEGQFVIPSTEWPGQNNVFRVHWLVQNGRKNIEISLKESTEAGKYLWAVAFSDRWVSPSPLSYRHSLRYFFGGMGRALSSIVGLPAMKRAVSDYEVYEELQQAAAEATRSALEGESGQSLDWTLYDPKIQESLAPALGNFLKAFAVQWEAGEPAQVASLVKDLGEDADEAVALARLTALRDAAFEKALLADETLLKIGATIPQLLLNRYRAQKIVAAAQNDFEKALSKDREKVKRLLEKKHPIRSRSESWLNKNVEKDVLANFDHLWSESFVGVPERMRAAGLEQEAALFEATWEYYQGSSAEVEAASVAGMALENEVVGRGLALREELESAIIPSRTFVLPSYRWSSANWKIENQAEPGNQPYYAAETAKKVEVSTRWPLWRVWLAGARVRTYFNNVARFFAVDGFRRGYGIPGMGWDSLWARNGEEVVSSESVNRATGEIEMQKKASISSLRAAWKKMIIAANERDLPKGKTSLLGEAWHARLTWVKNNFLKGAVSNVVLPAVLVPANVGLCVASAVAACVLPTPLALAGPSLEYLWTQLVWDHDHPRGVGTASLSPVIKNLLIDTTLIGGGEFVVNSVVFGLQAFGSPVILVGGQVRHWVNTKWDAMIRGLATRNILKLYVPGEDSWLSRRIEGPGLASEYSFQVKPEVLVVGVQALLETLERAHFSLVEKARLREPLEFHDAVAKTLFGGSESFLRSAVAGPVGAHLQTLDKALEAAQKAAPNVAASGEIRNSVRLNKADLEKALVDALPVVRAFYENRLAKTLGADTEKFWKDLDLVSGDFLGLTRSLIAQVFGENILVPVDEADESFRIVAADAPGIGDVVGNILSATSSLDWDTKPVQMVQEWQAPAARRRQLSVGGSVVNATALLEPCELAVIKSHFQY